MTDAAVDVRKLADELPALMQNVARVYYRVGEDRTFDDLVFRAIDRVRKQARRGVSAPTEIVDPGVLLHEMRLFKGPEEIDRMRRAAEATRGRALVLKVDTERHPNLASRFGVRNIPSFVLLKDGAVIGQHAGLVDHARLEQWLAQAATGEAR